MRAKKAIAALCVLPLGVAGLFSMFGSRYTADEIPALHLPQPGNVSTQGVQAALGGKVEILGGTRPVYRLQAVDADAERQKICRLFGLEPSEVGGFPDGNRLKDGASVGLDTQTGRWFYEKPLDWDAAASGMLSDEEAVERARAFIAQNELYPVEDLGQAKIGETYTGGALEGNKQTLRKTVYFYPALDGKAVYGNFRIGIALDPAGDIVGVDKFACAYELADQVPAKDRDAVEQALAGRDYVLSAETAPNHLTITEVSDAFYADPESRYLQPIYVFQTEVGSLWMDAAKR